MAEPRTRRRYTRKQKLAAVLAADMGGVVMAERETGIPESTIRTWVERPEFAEYRAKAREDLAEEVRIVAHLAWKRVAEGLLAGTFEPRDALFAAEKASTISELVSGHATSRSEHRSVTDGLDDHERVQLRDAIDDWLKERA